MVKINVEALERAFTSLFGGVLPMHGRSFARHVYVVDLTLITYKDRQLEVV